MSAQFDPYYKWLGIPPEEQPPHHYRLLGLKTFETDADVIESASDQRMAHLRTRAAGKHAEASQKLLNEISAAKVTLLDPERRADYDRQLRISLAAAQPKVTRLPKAAPLAAPASAESLPFPAVAKPPLARPAAVAADRRRTFSILIVAGGAAVLLLATVLVVVAMNIGGGSSPPVAVNAPPQPVPEAPGPAEPAGAMPVANPVPAPAPLPVEPAPPAVPVSPTVEPPIPEVAVPRTIVTPLQAAIAPAQGQPLDLLAQIDTKRDAVSGPWEFDGQALVRRDSQDDALLQVPVAPPVEYDLSLVVKRDGAQALGLGLVAGGKSCVLLIDNRGNRTGLFLDGQWSWETGQAACFQGTVAPPGKETRLVLNVRRDRLRLAADGELILDWAADYTRCGAHPTWRKPRNADQLYLASYQTRLQVPECKLIPLAADAAPAAADRTPSRPAPPDEQQQLLVRQSLNEIYKLAAKKTSAEKLELARVFVRLADESRGKPVDRYVLLREAQRLAGEAGDYDLALAAVEGIAADFEIDGLLEAGRALIQLTGSAKDDASYGKLAELIPAWIARALAAGRADAAEKLLDSAVKAAQKPGGRRLTKPLTGLKSSVAEQAKQERRLELARQRLADNPDDPESNLVLGVWLCFTANDWKAGVAHLAKGGDAALSACAQMELAAAAHTTEGQIAVGDAWWDHAMKASTDDKARSMVRAVHWYRLAALQPLLGLPKAKVERRLKFAEPLQAAARPAASASPTAPKSRVLLVMSYKEEAAAAQQACELYGLPCDTAPSFDRNRADYSAYHTIFCGSNDMNYWGKEAASKEAAAFSHVERFVNEGGHLIVSGTFNGENMQHLSRFGIYTGFVHTSTFEPAGPASDLFFAGAEALVPASGRMTSAGHFECTRQHVVLLKRGPGPKAGGPALITREHENGHVTFHQCEPHWRGDMWLIPVLLNWVARGSKTP